GRSVGGRGPHARRVGDARIGLGAADRGQWRRHYQHNAPGFCYPTVRSALSRVQVGTPTARPITITSPSTTSEPTLSGLLVIRRAARRRPGTGGGPEGSRRRARPGRGGRGGGGPPPPPPAPASPDSRLLATPPRTPTRTSASRPAGGQPAVSQRVVAM